MPSARGRFLLLLPLLLLLVPFLFWPVISGLIASFTTASPFQVHPRFVGFANFASVLSDGYFRASVRTVVIFALLTTSAELILGLGIALLLNEPLRGRGALRVLLLVPWLIGPIANGVMWHFLFATDSGIAGYVLGLLGLPAPPSPLGVSRAGSPGSDDI